MAAYYIDPVGGSANAAGTSAAQPRLTHRDLNIQPGDTVLFKRGSLIRGALGNVQGTEENPVTYGAYGEGENPAFSGSVDVSREENWEAVPGSPNVWRCLGPLTTHFPHVLGLDFQHLGHAHAQLFYLNESCRKKFHFFDATALSKPHQSVASGNTHA